MKAKSDNNYPENPVSLPNFRIEQSRKIDITANGGLFLLAELIKQIEWFEKLARLNIFQRQKIGEAVHILALVLNQFTGGDAIYDTRNLKDDEALRAIFGDLHIPAPHTSGDFLERFTEDAVERLRTIIHKMQAKYLKKLARKLKKSIVISLDSSIYEVFGNCKERSSQSFKNIFGFHPLFLHIHDTGELLDIIFRGGNAFTSTGAAQMLKDNIDRLSAYFDEITLLADSGFYEKAIVEACEEKGIKFIITSELSAPIKRRLASSELAWTAPGQGEEAQDAAVKHRDSHSMNHRMENLKQNLKKRGKVLKIRGPVEITEFQHTVQAWDHKYRFVYKRQLIFKQDLSSQIDCLEETEEYFYHGYVTNISQDVKSIEEIILMINSRGHQENFIKDFKQGLGTVHIPTKHFYGNYAYFLISMLSWNLKCWLLYTIEPELKIHWKRFRYLFVKVGAQIIKTGRYVVIRFGKGFGRVKEFVTWFERLKKPVLE